MKLKKDIYIVICYSKKDLSFCGVAINGEYFTSKENAIFFCESRLTSEELEHHKKQLNRGLISWYEFDSSKYRYEIKVLD